MFTKTSQKRVLFSRNPMSLIAGLLSVVAILYGSLAFYPGQAVAATSSTINFQARLQTVAGAVTPDGFYNAQFKLYSASSGGTALWTETYFDSNGVTAGNDNRVKVANGYVGVALGSQTAFPSTIDWNQELYLTLNIGGTAQVDTPSWDGEMNPRLKLTGVPYAFRAGQLAQFNSATNLSSTLQLLQPTGGNQSFQIQDQGAAGTYNLCVQNSTDCGFAAATGGTGYLQNQSALQQANTNFWMSGIGRADTALQAPLFDAPTAVSLNIGTTNATSLTLGRTGVDTFVGGSLSVGTTQSLGAITIANGAWFTAVDSAGTGTVNMFQVNSSNQIQVGAALNVDGDINTTGSYRVNGTTICSSSGCTAASGSSNYIQNSTGGPQIANMNIQSAASDSVGISLQAAASQSADLLQLKDSSGMTILSKFGSDGQLCIGAGSCTNMLGVSGNIAASGTITASATPDIAETIAAAPDVGAADVVMADPNQTERVVKASGAYNGAALGVISDGTSSFLINAYGASESAGLTGKPLVLAGRVPVKISGENGAISPGDYLTTSARLPGYAMKATSAGATIGKSLGFFNPVNSESTGTVLVLVNLSYYNPASGAVIQGSDAGFSSLNISGATTLQTLTVLGSASFKGDLQVAGRIDVQTITVNGHIMTSGDAPTAQIGDAAGKPKVNSGIVDASTQPTVTLSGNDTAGTVTIASGDNSISSGALAHLSFAATFDGSYTVVISPSNGAASKVAAYAVRTASGFDIVTDDPVASNGDYQFDYIVLGAATKLSY